MEWIVFILLYIASGVTGTSFEVGGSRYTVLTGITRDYANAASYCAANGLGDLAAFTYRGKHRQISEWLGREVQLSGIVELWIRGYDPNNTIGVLPISQTTQEVPTTSYKCLITSNYWQSTEELTYNIGSKPCWESRKFLCELRVPLASQWMVQGAGERLVNHVLQTTAARTHLLCAKACHVMQTCKSYNYNALSKECELNDAGLEVSSDVSEEEGWTWSWY